MNDVKTRKGSSMTRSTFSILIVALLAVGGLAACGGEGNGTTTPPSPNCETAEDCSDGEICLSGYCQASCQEDTDCSGDSETCFAGGCVQSCASGSCPDLYSCTNGNVCWSDNEAAVEPCGSDLDCPISSYCANNSCNSQIECSSDSDCAGQNICANGQCRSGCRSGDDAPDRLQCPEGETCNSQNQCEPSGCAMGECGQYQFCDTEASSPSCKYEGNCPTDDEQLAQSICDAYAAQIGSDIEHTCQSGQCQEVEPCEDDGDCADGEICDVREDSRNVCRTGCRCTNASEVEGCNRDCSFGEICNTPEDDRDQGTEYTCYQGCTSNADCEQGEVCLEDDNICVSECASEQDCSDGQLCAGNPQICRYCSTDEGGFQCPATEVCNTDAASAPDDPSLGLCQDEPPSCPDDMFGNNHCPTQAATITSGDLPFSASPTYCTENASGEGTTCGTLQSEWFKVEVPDGQIVNIELNYPEEVQGDDGDPVSTGNLDVVLFESLSDGSVASQPLVQSSRPPSEEDGMERIEYGVNHGNSSPKPYYIQVRGSVPQDASPITYDLSTSLSSPVSCSQQDDSSSNNFEENDTRQTATAVQAVDPMDPAISGLRVCGDDEDFYELDVGANQIVNVSAKAPPRLGDIGLQLIDPASGTVLQTSETSSRTETIQYEVTQPTKLVARVYLESGVGNVEYEFKWTEEPNPCADPFEPNNVCGPDVDTLNNSSNGDSASFQNIPVCQTPNSPGEGDYYKFELDPLDELQVKVTYDQQVQQGVLQAILYGPNSCPTKISDAQESTNSQGETVLTLDLSSDQVQIGGNYYLQVAIFQSNGAVDYDLSYTITPGPACQQDQYDLGGSSNDTFNSATQLSSQNIKNGGEDSVFNNLQICTNDKDFFCTTLDPSTNNSIEYEVRFDHNGGQGDLSAFLVGPDQSSGTPNTVLDSSTSSTDNETVSISGISQAGEYCVNVQSAGGTRNNYTLLPFVDGQGNADPSCPDIYEDNDQCGSVMTCNASTNFPTGQLESNLLACSGDNDYYQVSAQPGQEVTATLSYTPADGIVNMELYQEATLSSGRIDFTNTASSPEQLTWDVTRQQNYYVNVYTTTRNYYALQIDKGPVSSCTDDSYDTGGSSNDSSGDAVQVDSPGLEVGRRICDSDEDWYKFDVDSGANFEVFANYDYSVGDVDITVYGPGGTSTQVGSGTTTTDDESVVVNDPAGGTYYVKVEAKNPARVDYDLLIYEDLDGDNTIEPNAGEGPEDKTCPDQFENNDSPGDAAQASIKNYDRLTMCADSGTDDKDYYQVYVPQDAKLSADLTFTHDQGDIDMRLYQGTSTSGTPVATSTTDTDGESLSMGSFSSGTDYLLEVVGDTATSGNNFRNMYSMNLSLSFSGTCNDDTFSVSASSGTGNNNQLSAESLNVEDYDGSYDLKLCEDSNTGSALSDWFTFTTSSQNDLLLSLEHKASQGEIEMELLDSAGSTVATSSAKYGTTDNVQEIDISGLAADTYDLRISSASGSPIRNDYDLYVEYGGSTPTQPYCPDVYERNDSSGSGVPAALNYPTEFQYTDARVCGSESDWYTASLQSGTTYRFETYFDHSSSSDIDVQVLDPSGSIVTDINGTQASFANSSGTNDEFWAFTPSTSGTFKIGLKNSGNDDVGAPFQLGTDSMYSTGSASADCPSDNAGSTQSLAPTIGQTLPFTRGYALCSDDDWLRWTAPQSIPSNLEVTVFHDNNDYSGSSLTPLNFGLSVQESGGSTVASDPAPSGSNPSDNRASVSFNPSAGTTYFIQVQRGLAPGTSNTTHGPYLLRLNWANP